MAPFFLPFLADTPIESDDIMNLLFPNGFGWDFVIQLMAFVVLLLIVFYLGYKPVKKYLKARQDYIEKNIKDSEKSKEEAEIYVKESKDAVLAAKEEAKRIVKDATDEANLSAENIRDEAKKDALLTRKKADEEIALAREKARKDAKDEIVGVAIAASSQVLGREVNEEDEKRLLKDFMNDVEER